MPGAKKRPQKSNFPGGASALFSHSAWQQRGVRLKKIHGKNCSLLILARMPGGQRLSR